MSDKFTEITTVGLGGRITKSIKGVLLGIVLFVGSFGLLYWNEGRVDISNIAKKAVEINAETENAEVSLNGKLVSASGIVNSNQIIGDNLFLKPDRFMVVERRVEMYAWVEKSRKKSKRNVGGSETSKKTYTYLKEWAERPESSSDFKYPEEHQNPQKSLDSYTGKTTAATIGLYSFNPQSIKFPDASVLPLNSKNTNLSSGAILANGSYLFLHKSDSGTFLNPQIGDLRISYYVIHPNFNGTIFGKLNGNKIDPYHDQDGNYLYRIFFGNREDGIATLHSEFTNALWIMRLVGFLIMWAGLSFLFGPISTLLDILPIFRTISRFFIGAVTFFVSLVLAVVTIAVSFIFNSIIMLFIVVILVIAIIVLLLFMWRKRRETVSIPKI